jgi:hypothetical protein
MALRSLGALRKGYRSDSVLVGHIKSREAIHVSIDGKRRIQLIREATLCLDQRGIEHQLTLHTCRLCKSSCCKTEGKRKFVQHLTARLGFDSCLWGAKGALAPNLEYHRVIERKVSVWRDT